MIKKHFTVGSDPEFFASNGEYPVPSYHFLPGTKDAPFPMEGAYTILRDNVTVEGNIPPAHSKEEFIDNMNKLMALVTENFLAPAGMHLIHEDSVAFRDEDLAHPEAYVFGCQPYMNAWSNMMEVPVGLEQEVSRPAGFHVHLGYQLTSKKYTKKVMDKILVRAFDVLAMSEFLTEHYDEFRMKFYGGFGKYRRPVYGVEFRSLGSFWSDPKYLGRVYDKVEEVVDVCRNPINTDFLLKLKLAEPTIKDLIEIKDQLIINKIKVPIYQTV